MAQVQLAESVVGDPETDLVMSPGLFDASVDTNVVSSGNRVLLPKLVDYQNPELVDLECEALLGKFTPDIEKSAQQVVLVSTCYNYCK